MFNSTTTLTKQQFCPQTVVLLQMSLGPGPGNKTLACSACVSKVKLTLVTIVFQYFTITPIELNILRPECWSSCKGRNHKKWKRWREEKFLLCCNKCHCNFIINMGRNSANATCGITISSVMFQQLRNILVDILQ